MKIYCITGKAGSGKDTFAQIMKEELQAGEDNGYKRVLITHYADLLKYICKAFFGWDGQKDEVGRRLLQYVGTDVIRRHNPGYWVDFIAEVLALFHDQWDYVLIPDCRFPNEYYGLVDKGFDATLIRITRPDLVSSLTAEQQRHASETSMDDMDVYYEVLNDSTLDHLRKIARDILEI